MPDDLNKRGTQDRNRVSLEEEDEVQYWIQALGVSREELERTFRSVGHNVEDVKRAVQKAV